MGMPCMQEGGRRRVMSCDVKVQGTGGTMVREKFTRIQPEIGIKKIDSTEIKDIWSKIGQYVD
jgi:hypothetical protein